MGLKIISLYRSYPEMLERLEKNRKLIRLKTLQETILKRLNEKDLYHRPDKRTEFSAMVADRMNLERIDSHSARKAVQQIENFKLEEKIQGVHKQMEPMLPDLTVYISLNNPRHPYMRRIRGVSGFTEKNNIIIFVWPEKNWQDAVLPEFVRQVAYSIRKSKIGQKSLLEEMISEGVADSLVLEILGQPNKMRVPSEMKLWNMYKQNMNITSKKKMHKLVFGDGKKIPLMAGRFMGYRIVQNHLQKTGKSAREVLKTSASKILEESDYAKK